jgi:hypothetical protein
LLAQAFRTDFPEGVVDYYGGERTRELEEASVGRIFDARFSVLGSDLVSVVAKGQARANEIGGYDFVMNIEQSNALKAVAMLLNPVYVCGPCLNISGRGDLPYEDNSRGELWSDKAWVAPDITSRFPFLRSSFIGEIFHQLAYRDGPLPRYWFPEEPPEIVAPKVLIATGASLPEKLWPPEKWRQLLKAMDTEVGLLGAPPRRQAEFYHSNFSEDRLVAEGLVIDLRGKLSLPQVVGALKRANVVVTIDNGILHFAAANDVPTVGLYRRDIVRLWAPPNPNLITLVPKMGSVADIEVESVKSAYDGALERLS